MRWPLARTLFGRAGRWPTVLYSRRFVAPRADVVVSAFGDDHSRGQTASTAATPQRLLLARGNDCADHGPSSTLGLGTIAIVANILRYHSVNLVLALGRSFVLESDATGIPLSMEPAMPTTPLAAEIESR